MKNILKFKKKFKAFKKYKTMINLPKKLTFQDIKNIQQSKSLTTINFKTNKNVSTKNSQYAKIIKILNKKR